MPPRLTLPATALALLTFTAISAPLIANDQPLVISFRHHLYLPLIQPLPGQFFSPTLLPTPADYKNPETQAAITAQGWLLFPPIPYSANTIAWSAPPPPPPPTRPNLLGPDAASRDVAARLIYGLRSSLIFGALLTLLSTLIGTTAGAIQGYYGGLTDLLLQRFTEIWSGLPQLLLIIILASIIKPSFATLLLFLLAFSWMQLAARVRAEFLRARNLDYVLAARIIGAPTWRIILLHILPNAHIAIISLLPFIMADSITLLAAFDYLGVGLPTGAPSLGELLTEAKNNPQDPWLAIAAITPLATLLIALVSLARQATPAKYARLPTSPAARSTQTSC